MTCTYYSLDESYVMSEFIRMSEDYRRSMRGIKFRIFMPPGCAVVYSDVRVWTL
jgi:hypothetical protein